MDICSNGHEEIVYEGRYCPMCTMIDNHKEELERLEDKISEIEEA